MFPGRIRGVVTRKLIKELDVTGKPDTYIAALYQIVGKKSGWREAPCEHLVESPGIVDTLAVIRSLTGQILVNVRHGSRIRI